MKSFKLRTIFILLFFATITNSCKKDELNNKISKAKVTGFVQKGPFINGTTIDIYELNDSLGQTGKSFNTTIVDNIGSFEIENIELNSQYVQFKALGFYFNEVTGEKSSAQFALNALSDLKNISSVNVNILTHLEESRVKYLVKEGISFSNAKDSAQQEVLRIFGFERMTLDKSEKLDISVDNDNNAILLAISVILQGNRGVADLTEIMANIITDIKEDGILNNDKIKSDLYNTAQHLDLTKIRENLEKRYKELNANTTIPNFEKYFYSYLELAKPFNIDVKETNVTCHGFSNGKIDITVNEGTSPFKYSWSNGDVTEDLINIPAGSYSVTITDKNNFIMTKQNIRVYQPNSIYIVGNLTNPICESNSGSIDVAVTGGILPYSYLWSNDASTEDLSEIKAGNYSITVTDSNKCSSVQPFSLISTKSEIKINGNVTNIKEGTTSGSINTIVSVGTEPYQYSWSNGALTKDMSNLKEGKFKLTVTDKNGCTTTTEYAVYNLNPIKDIDGNVYKVVLIGNQVWMAENLKTTHFSNGDDIPNSTDSLAWANSYSDAFCWYNNDKQNYGNIYGALYKYNTLNDTRNVCPSGSHVATELEWTNLVNYLGGESIAASKLKEAGTTHWNDPNADATNETGFTALPGGLREGYDAGFHTIQIEGTWWSIYNGKVKTIEIYQSSIIFNYKDYGEGRSVRCIKE